MEFDHYAPGPFCCLSVAWFSKDSFFFINRNGGHHKQPLGGNFPLSRVTIFFRQRTGTAVGDLKKKWSSLLRPTVFGWFTRWSPKKKTKQKVFTPAWFPSKKKCVFFKWSPKKRGLHSSEPSVFANFRVVFTNEKKKQDISTNLPRPRDMALKPGPRDMALKPGRMVSLPLSPP